MFHLLNGCGSDVASTSEPQGLSGRKTMNMSDTHSILLHKEKWPYRHFTYSARQGYFKANQENLIRNKEAGVFFPKESGSGLDSGRSGVQPHDLVRQAEGLPYLFTSCIHSTNLLQ